MRKILSFFIAVLLLTGAVPGQRRGHMNAQTERAAAESVFAAPEQQGAGKTTVMVYMTGSDLEPKCAAATKDMQEMMDSGVDLSVTNVVIYTGGAEKWHSDVPENMNAVLQLTENGFERLEAFEIMSMGAPENLSRFLNYAYEHFPAETYDLILWDHGSGPIRGYCLDKRFADDTLTLKEMREALSESPFSGTNKLGFIGFDACLMASAELVCMLGEFADYMVFSQETEPSFGWNYAFLSDCGTLPTKELAVRIADVYLEYCEAYYERNNRHSDVTLSVVDLSLADELRDAVCDLFRSAAPDVMSRFTRIASFRVNARSFGKANTNVDYDLVDLNSLAQEMGAFYPEEARRLTELLDRLVVSAVSNTEQSCGVSLFFPFFRKSDYSAFSGEVYREMGVFPEYQNFLNRYEQTWLSSDMQALFDAGMNIEKQDDGTYFLPLSEEQLDAVVDGKYYVLRRLGEGMYAPIYIGSNVEKTDGGVAVSFDGRIIYCEDVATGERTIPTLRLTDRIGSRVDYSIMDCAVQTDYLFTTENTIQRCEVQISADLSDGQVEIRGVYEQDDDAEGIGKRTEIDLSEWNVLSVMELPARYLERSENGRIIGFNELEKSSWYYFYEFPLADEIRFVSDSLYDDGYEYDIMFELTDAQGNSSCTEPFMLEPESAQRAENGDSAPAVRIPWESGAVVYEEHGVTVRIDCTGALNGWKTEYVVSVRNENGFPVNLALRDASVNGITMALLRTNLSVNPGETKTVKSDILSKLTNKTGQEEALRFRLYAENADSRGLLFDRWIEPVGKPKKGASFSAPLLDARADEQVIYSDGEIEVTLMKMAYFGSRWSLFDEAVDAAEDDAEMTLLYRIENRSGVTHAVSVPMLKCNGVSIGTSTKDIKSFLDLKPHNTCYILQTVTREQIMFLNPHYSIDTAGEAPMIASVSEAEALFVIDGNGIWCPIALKEKGTGELLRPEGELLYEDETWSIYRDPAQRQIPEIVCLWVVNRSDRLYYGSIDAERDYLFTYETFAPQSAKYVWIWADLDTQKEQKIRLDVNTWEQERQPFRTEPAHTEWFGWHSEKGADRP